MGGTLTASWLWSTLLAVGLVFIAVLMRVQLRSWMSPGALFALVWSAFVCVPLLMLPGVEVWPGAVLAIALAVLIVCAGAFLGAGGVFPRAWHMGPLPDGRQQEWDRPTKFLGLTFLTVGCSVVGLLGVAILLWSEGFGLSDLGSLEQAAEIARIFSVARYQEGYSPPVSVRLMTVAMYTGALFGGALFLTAKSRLKKALALLPFVPAVLFMAVLTTRAVFLFQVVLWVSSWMALGVVRYGPLARLFTGFRVLVSALMMLTALAIVSLVLVARHAVEVDAFVSVVWPQLRGDIVGHLPAFGDWLHVALRKELSLTYGAFTFGGIFELLNLQERLPGIYEENIQMTVGGVIVESNIFTAFRGLIQDFGYLGAIAGLFLIGFCGGSAFRSAARGQIAAAPWLAAYYMFAIWSPIGSFAVYNTILAAYLLFGLYLWGQAGLQVVVQRRPLTLAGSATSV